MAVCILSLPLLAGAAPAPRKIVMVSATEVRESVLGAWLELIYAEAFRRLGYQLDYQAYPARRASALASAGDVDGEIHRFASYGKANPRLVRVDEPHFSGVFAAYAIRPLPLAAGWDALKDSGYLVEYRFGCEKCAAELAPRVAPARLSTVSSTVLGLRKLANGRTDIYIDGDFIVDANLHDSQLKGAAIRKLADMEEVGGYAFLHVKHRALAAQLAGTLAQMKKEGLVQRYRQQALEGGARKQAP